MINWFKKHFIPHEGNDHRPHILNKENTRNFVILVLLIEAFVFLVPMLSHINMKGGMAAVLPAVLSDLTNEERQTENLNQLKTNPILNEAAQMKAEDMAQKGYFAHTSPEGLTPWYWLKKVGYQYKYAGENLAINFTDSKDVTKAWMNSPTHKANIIKNNYVEVGTGVATGIYEGRETVFVAQVYASPLSLENTNVVSSKNNTVVNDNKNNINNIDNNVLGAETQLDNNDITNTPDENSNEVLVNNTSDTELVKPDLHEDVKNPTLIQKAIASPRNTTNIIMYSIFTLILISFIIYLVIRSKNHHIDIVTNALIVLVIIIALFITNQYLSNRNMTITQSMDYSQEESQ